MKSGMLFIGVILSVIFTGCESVRCIKGNGDLVTDNVEVEGFTQVSSAVSFDVFLEQDTLTEVIIQADDNLIPYIKAEVAGGELLISTANDRCLRSRNDIRIFVKTPDIDRIILDGSGDIIVDDLSTVDLKLENRGSGLLTLSDVYVDDIIIDVMGSGDIIMATLDAISIDALVGGSGDLDLGIGAANLATYVIEGSGDILGDAVELLECEVIIDGSGDITVWATVHLYGEIFGSGHVFYRMLPTKGIHINNSTPDNLMPLEYF